MERKYKEMTKEQLGKEANEILKRLRGDTRGTEPVWMGDIDTLQEIIDIMKQCKVDGQINKIFPVKEKITKALGDFLNRNKNYAVELYISNAVTKKVIGKIFIASDRVYNADDKKFTVEWDKDASYDVRYNNFSVPYEEIMKWYEEVEKEDKLKITETVVVILKNGMEFDFCCNGIRI